MQIDITDIGEDGRTLRLNEPAGSFTGLAEIERTGECAFSGPVSVAAELLFLGQDRFRLRGRVDVPVRLPCARCLTIYSDTMGGDIDLVFVRHIGESPPPGKDGVVELSEADVDEVVFDGDTLDLAAVLQEELLAALPVQPRCKDACKGLCPVCGANRNETTCDCHADTIDPRLAVLKQFKGDTPAE